MGTIYSHKRRYEGKIKISCLSSLKGDIPLASLQVFSRLIAFKMLIWVLGIPHLSMDQDGIEIMSLAVSGYHPVLDDLASTYTTLP